MTETRDKLDDVARKYMDNVGGQKLSLDEWLVQYDEELTPSYKQLGYAILTMYSEYGGPVE